MKTPTTKAIWLAAGISLGLHAVFFLTWLNNHNLIHDTKTTSNNHTINLRLTAKENTQKQEATIPRTRPDKTIIKATPGVEERPQQKVKVSATTSKSIQSTLATKSIAEESDRLYSLLYSAINQQKHYPLSALRMRQQGKVCISFKLFNNGNLDDVKVSHSSGYNSLDNAALLAVKRIQPFHPAADYIASVKGFQLDIIFQL